VSKIIQEGQGGNIYCKPGVPDSGLLYGHKMLINGHPKRAAEYYATALGEHHHRPDFWQNLPSAILQQSGSEELGLICARRAVALDPENPGLLQNLSSMSWRLGHIEEAKQALERADELDPNNWVLLMDLAEIASLQEDYERCAYYYNRTRECAPKDDRGVQSMIDFQESFTMMMVGDYKNGLAFHEGRFGQHTTVKTQVWELGAPEWRGEDLTGKHIMIHQDQGDGDTVMFVRYLRELMLIPNCRVSLAVPDRLMRLLHYNGIYNIYGDLPKPDYHSPVASFAQFLDCEIPSWGGSYVRKTEDIKAPVGFNIGICWTPKAEVPDQQRQVPFLKMAALAELPGVILHSLQIERNGVLKTTGADMFIRNRANEIRDWQDTANLMASMDLIVSIDSGPAHVAGALGMPTFCLLPYRASWRWGVREMSTTPWYPSMRLFRQPETGDWETPFEQLRAAIRETLG